MTVGELKKMLVDVPDNVEVVYAQNTNIRDCECDSITATAWVRVCKGEPLESVPTNKFVLI